MLYENNAAVKFALTMHQRFFIAPEDLVCHVAPQSKSVLLQQIAVFLMVSPQTLLIIMAMRLSTTMS